MAGYAMIQIAVTADAFWEEPDEAVLVMWRADYTNQDCMAGKGGC